ncbi:MAG: efflux RND transporter periplasmic adaptor subunit [Chitinophagaceae bacterium]
MRQYYSIYPLILIFLFGFLFYGCNENKTTRPLGRYTVEIVQRGNAIVHTQFPTQLESQQVVNIYPRVTGYIKQIYVHEGDNIKKGAPIVKIIDDEYLQNVNATKAAYNNAKLEVEKLKPLVAKDIVSHYQLETAQSNLELAKANYDYAKITLGYTLISSPVSGVVGRIILKVGSLLTTGNTDPFTTVAANGNVFAYFSVDEKQLLKIDTLPGTLQQKIARSPKVDLLLSDGTPYIEKGKVELGSSLIDPTTGSLQLKAVFPNSTNLLRTGSSGIVLFPTSYRNVLLVSQKATFDIQDKKLLYKIDSSGIVHATNITVNSEAGSNYVVSSGIKEGDMILIEGVTRVKDGDKIIPVINEKK